MPINLSDQSQSLLWDNSVAKEKPLRGGNNGEKIGEKIAFLARFSEGRASRRVYRRVYRRLYFLAIQSTIHENVAKKARKSPKAVVGKGV